MITEYLMKPGRFDVEFAPATPFSIRSKARVLDHVVVTPTRIDPNAIGDASVLDVAIYTGVITGRPDASQITGAGLAYWLGTDDGRGDLLDTSVTNTSASLSTWISSLLPSSIAVGTVTNTGVDLTYTFQWVTRREAIDWVCAQVGAEWRVNHDGTFDAAAPATLFGTAPDVVITRYEESAEAYRGLSAEDLVRAIDVEGYSTKVIVVGQTGDGAAVATGSASTSTTYKDLFNGTAVFERLVNDATVPASLANTLATNLLALFGTRYSATLSSDTYAVGRFVRPGEYVYVYDLDGGFVDQANQINWRGNLIAPLKLRVKGITWPIVRGMGVYVRQSGGTATYYDITDHIAYEDGPTTWEVGSATGDVTEDPSQISPAYLGANSDVVNRVLGAVTQAWTPTLTASTTNPTMGSGATASGLYKIIDGWCWFQCNIQFGSSGAAAGSGNYTITGLPVVPKAGRGTFLSGRARLTDASGSVLAYVDALVNDSAGIGMRYPATYPTGTEFQVANGSPWTWANNDRLEVWGCYPVL